MEEETVIDSLNLQKVESRKRHYKTFIIILIILILLSILSFFLFKNKSNSSLCSSECSSEQATCLNSFNIKTCNDNNEDGCAEIEITSCENGCKDGFCIDKIIPNCSEDNYFKFAFVLLVREESDITQSKIDKINEIKSTFKKHFEYATNNLAFADVSYPVKIIIDDGTLMNEDKTEFFRDKVPAKFLEDNPDEFDFIISIAGFDNSPTIMENYRILFDYFGLGASYSVVFNKIHMRNESYKYITGDLRTNKLKSSIYWSTVVGLENYNISDNSFYNGLLHEVGHAWCCFVGSDFSGGDLIEIEQAKVNLNTLINNKFFIDIISDSKVRFTFYNQWNGSNISFLSGIGESFIIPRGFYDAEQTFEFRIDDINDNYVTLTSFIVPSLEIIQEGMHFYRGLDSPYETGTPMNSDNWIPNGDGSYRRTEYIGEIEKYHPIQLYFMGLLTKDNYDFDKKFQVFNAGTGVDFNPERAYPYKEVSINDIIKIEGERVCVF